MAAKKLYGESVGRGQLGAMCKLEFLNVFRVLVPEVWRGLQRALRGARVLWRSSSRCHKGARQRSRLAPRPKSAVLPAVPWSKRGKYTSIVACVRTYSAGLLPFLRSRSSRLARTLHFRRICTLACVRDMLVRTVDDFPVPADIRQCADTIQRWRLRSGQGSWPWPSVVNLSRVQVSHITTKRTSTVRSQKSAPRA